MNTHILEKLYNVLQDRKSADPDGSYVASLYAEGTPMIAKKILEETREFIDETYVLDVSPQDDRTQKKARHEAADLLFHMMVLLAHHNIEPQEVFAVLEERFGIGGHEEKASRTT